MEKRRKGLFTALIFVVAALAVVYLVVPDGSLELSEKVPYSEFSSMCSSGEVLTVTLGENSIRFTTSDGRSLKTQNPSSDDLVERLLLQGIEVKDGSGKGVSYWLDIAFDAIFFGAILFGLAKLLGWYTKTFRLVRKTGVTFADIAGMKGPKRDMSYLVKAMADPKAFEKRGMRLPRGVILEGTPGNGKTLFARALASEAKVNFIATRGADFQGSLMGLGAFKVRLMFARARRHAPCLVFIDEFDSIGERRNYAGSGIDKENNRIITTLLNEMDGFSSSSGVVVVAATNSYQSLDPALVRPGRFDMKYTVSNPDLETRLELVGIYTRGRSLDGITAGEVAGATDGLSCAAIESVLNEAWILSRQEGLGGIGRDCLREAARKTGVKVRL